MIPVADQFEDIRKRREEIAREEGRKGTGEIIEPPCDTEQPRMEDYACGLFTRFVRREIYACGFRTPGEFTDGA